MTNYEKPSNSLFTKSDTNIAKCVAVILMFIHHLFAFPERLHNNVSFISAFTFKNTPVEQYIGVFGQLCVSIFMFLSGLGIYICVEKSKNITNIVTRRLKNTYITYWEVFLVFIPIGLILDDPNIGLSINEFICNFFALKVSYNMEWWFITAYLIILLLTPWIISWVNRATSQLYTDIVLIMIFHLIATLIIPELIKLAIFNKFRETLVWNAISITLRYISPFVMGCLIVKYELFLKYWRIFNNKFLLVITSFVLCILIFFLRLVLGSIYDFIWAPIFIVSTTTLIRNIPLLRELFNIIGKRSAKMWLIHSFYCYYFFQEIIFAPKYSIIILIFLLIASYLSAFFLDKFYDFALLTIKKVWKDMNHKI